MPTKRRQGVARKTGQPRLTKKRTKKPKVLVGFQSPSKVELQRLRQQTDNAIKELESQQVVDVDHMLAGSSESCDSKGSINIDDFDANSFDGSNSSTSRRTHHSISSESLQRSGSSGAEEMSRTKTDRALRKGRKSQHRTRSNRKKDRTVASPAIENIKSVVESALANAVESMTNAVVNQLAQRRGSQAHQHQWAQAPAQNPNQSRRNVPMAIPYEKTGVPARPRRMPISHYGFEESVAQQKEKWPAHLREYKQLPKAKPRKRKGRKVNHVPSYVPSIEALRKNEAGRKRDFVAWEAHDSRRHANTKISHYHDDDEIFPAPRPSYGIQSPVRRGGRRDPKDGYGSNYKGPSGKPKYGVNPTNEQKGAETKDDRSEDPSPRKRPSVSTFKMYNRNMLPESHEECETLLLNPSCTKLFVLKKNCPRLRGLQGDSSTVPWMRNFRNMLRLASKQHWVSLAAANVVLRTRKSLDRVISLWKRVQGLNQSYHTESRMSKRGKGWRFAIAHISHSRNISKHVLRSRAKSNIKRCWDGTPFKLHLLKDLVPKLRKQLVLLALKSLVSGKKLARRMGGKLFERRIHLISYKAFIGFKMYWRACKTVKIEQERKEKMYAEQIRNIENDVNARRSEVAKLTKIKRKEDKERRKLEREEQRLLKALKEFHGRKSMDARSNEARILNRLVEVRKQIGVCEEHCKRADQDILDLQSHNEHDLHEWKKMKPNAPHYTSAFDPNKRVVDCVTEDESNSDSDMSVELDLNTKPSKVQALELDEAPALKKSKQDTLKEETVVNNAEIINKKFKEDLMKNLLNSEALAKEKKQLSEEIKRLAQEEEELIKEQQQIRHKKHKTTTDFRREEQLKAEIEAHEHKIALDKEKIQNEEELERELKEKIAQDSIALNAVNVIQENKAKLHDIEEQRKREMEEIRVLKEREAQLFEEKEALQAKEAMTVEDQKREMQIIAEMDQVDSKIAMDEQHLQEEREAEEKLKQAIHENVMTLETASEKAKTLVHSENVGEKVRLLDLQIQVDEDNVRFLKEKEKAYGNKLVKRKKKRGTMEKNSKKPLQKVESVQKQYIGFVKEKTSLREQISHTETAKWTKKKAKVPQKAKAKRSTEQKDMRRRDDLDEFAEVFSEGVDREIFVPGEGYDNYKSEAEMLRSTYKTAVAQPLSVHKARKENMQFGVETKEEVLASIMDEGVDEANEDVVPEVVASLEAAGMHILQSETENLRIQIQLETKNAERYFRYVKRLNALGKIDYEREGKLEQYRVEIKSLVEKRNKIKAVVDEHKALRHYQAYCKLKYFYAIKNFCEKKKDHIELEKRNRLERMRLAFEGLLRATRESTVALTDYAGQFRVVQDCFSSWRQFCVVSKEAQEEKIKMETATFIHATRLKYRYFVQFCMFTEQSRLLKKRMNFSAWQEVWKTSKQEAANRKLQRKYLINWNAHTKVVRNDKSLLSSVLTALKGHMEKKRCLEEIGTQFRCDKLKYRVFHLWKYALIDSLKQKVMMFRLNRMFNTWNRNAESRKVLRAKRRVVVQVKKVQRGRATPDDRKKSADHALVRQDVILTPTFGREIKVPKVKLGEQNIRFRQNLERGLKERKINLSYFVKNKGGKVRRFL
jgi:hypothetical protein